MSDDQRVYLPLHANKQPMKAGWADPTYTCTEAEALEQSPVIGLRCDDLVIVDCDTMEAAARWYQVTGDACNHAVKTPRGVHFYYRWVEGAPLSPAVGIAPDTDLRAGRGSYVVCPPSPGYAEIEIEGVDGA